MNKSVNIARKNTTITYTCNFYYKNGSDDESCDNEYLDDEFWDDESCDNESCDNESWDNESWDDESLDYYNNSSMFFEHDLASVFLDDIRSEGILRVIFRNFILDILNISKHRGIILYVILSLTHKDTVFHCNVTEYYFTECDPKKDDQDQRKLKLAHMDPKDTFVRVTSTETPFIVTKKSAYKLIGKKITFLEKNKWWKSPIDPSILSKIKDDCHQNPFDICGLVDKSF
jgi:hypothetical protein